MDLYLDHRVEKRNQYAFTFAYWIEELDLVRSAIRS
jgi:hypothetical protein